MPKCKICGRSVVAGEVYHTDCIESTLPTWISVKDAMPPFGIEVLCWLGGFNKPMCGVYTYLENGKWEDEYGYWETDGAITHWMPLPAPPGGRK